jgi:hypothetical protein
VEGELWAEIWAAAVGGEGIGRWPATSSGASCTAFPSLELRLPPEKVRRKEKKKKNKKC